MVSAVAAFRLTWDTTSCAKLNLKHKNMLTIRSSGAIYIGKTIAVRNDGPTKRQSGHNNVGCEEVAVKFTVIS